MGVLGLSGLAVGTVLQARVRTRSGPAATASIELAAAFLVLAVWAPMQGSVAIPLTAHALLPFAWLALITGVGAPLLLFALIRQRGATRASSFLFVVLAVTAIAAWPVLGTSIGPLALVGLVVVGIALRLSRPGNRAGDTAVGLGDHRGNSSTPGWRVADLLRAK